MTTPKTTVRRRAGTPKPKAPPKKPKGVIQGRAPGKVERLVGLLFGPPKSGKTTGACSGRNVLLISFDPDGDYTETLQGRDDITVITPSIDEMDGIIKALYTTDAGRWDWIVVDSVTFLFQKAAGKDIYMTYKDNRDVRRPYGKAGAITAQIINDLVMLPPPTNVMFTAHLKHEGAEEELVKMDSTLGENEVRVAVTPMVWTLLGPAVSFIGRTFKKTGWEKVEGTKKRNKVTRFLVSFNDGERSPAGSRLPMDGEYINEEGWLQNLADELVKGA
jgi:hypothetical protein